MKIKLMLGVCAVLHLCCGGQTATKQLRSDAVSAPDDPVVAILGTEKIRMSQVDRLSETELRRARMALDQKVAEIRRQSLDALIEQKLVEMEVRLRGLESVEALARAEIIEKTQKPTLEEMKSFYDENRNEMGTVSFEEIKPKIALYLASQAHEVRSEEFMEELKTKYPITDRLSPFRVQVGNHGASKGPENASVTIVEYADFECPFCVQTAKTVEAIRRKYPEHVRIVFRHFPLSFHDHAMPAAIAARCAEKQGQFWGMHDLLFDSSETLNEDVIRAMSKTLELDQAKFVSCYESLEVKEAIQAEMEEGGRFGVEGTPAFFVNGIPLSGAQPYEAFSALVETELKKKSN